MIGNYCDAGISIRVRVLTL
jgi:hypothetical protein